MNHHIRVPVARPLRPRVPEPAAVALIVFACLLAAVMIIARLFLTDYLNLK